MSLETVNWKYVGMQAVGSSTVAAVLDALYTLGTKSTYYDGSARTPGSGQAGTFERWQTGGVTECVRATQQTNQLNLTHIFAGSASAKTPTMATIGDTFTTNCILYGLSRDSSTFTSWDAAQPMGSPFTGYVRSCNSGSITITKVFLFENKYGFWIIFSTNTGNVHTFCGELIDPMTTNSQSPNSAEAVTNSRICFFTSGSTSFLNFNPWSTTTSTDRVLLGHSTIANTAHFFTVNVGTVVLQPIIRDFETMQAGSTSTGINDDGDFIGHEIHIIKTITFTKIGILRGAYIGPDSKAGYTMRSGGVDIAYAASVHTASDSDTIWLKA